MKIYLRTRICLFLVFIIFTFKVNAQVNGGAISTSSVCASNTAPAAPLNNVSDASGGTAPYLYQWEARNDLSAWSNVIGGNGSSLNPGILFQSTKYRRKVTDAIGVVAFSNEISYFLVSNFSGGLIRFNDYDSVLVGTLPSSIVNRQQPNEGTGNYTYGWETADNAAGPWSVIAGETNNSYQPPIYNSIGSKFFRRKATDAICGMQQYSDIIELKIVSVLLFRAKNWSTQYLCVFPGYQPSFFSGESPLGGTTPYSFQWEKRVGVGSWEQIAGANSVSYQPLAITQSTQYRRRASDAAGAWGYSHELLINYVTGTANPGVISSTSPLIAPNAPTNAIYDIQSGSNFNGTGYFWESSTNNAVTWTPISNYTYSTYFLQAPVTIATCYRRAVTDACASEIRYAWTTPVCVTPAQPLTAGTIALGNGNVTCVNVSTSPGQITGTPATGGASPYTYQWQNNTSGTWGNIATANGQNYTPNAINQNTIYRRNVTDANGTTLSSNEISVIIQSNVSLKGGLIDGSIVTCSNTAPGIINNIIDACGGGGSLSYVWEMSTNNGAWNSIGGSNAPTHNAGSINKDTRYRRKVADGCGTAVYSNEVPVYVYPAIEAGTITPGTQTVCSTDLPQLLSLMQNCHYTNGNVSYQWQKSSNGTSSWINIENATRSFYQPRKSNTSCYYRLVVSSTVCGATAVSNMSSVIISTTCLGNASDNSNRMFSSIKVDNKLPSSLTTKGTLKLYPNPVEKGQTVFVTVTTDASNCKAILRGTDGRTYNCTITNTSKNSLQVRIPATVAQGTYLIQISNSQNQWIERVIVF